MLKDTGKKNGPKNKSFLSSSKHLTHPKTPKNVQVNNAMKKFGMSTFRKNKNVDLKTQKVQKTINKGGIILGQVAYTLIKLKHSKDMTVGDMKNAVVPLN